MAKVIDTGRQVVGFFGDRSFIQRAGQRTARHRIPATAELIIDLSVTSRQEKHTESN